MPTKDDPWGLLETTLLAYIRDSSPLESLKGDFDKQVPSSARASITALLSHSSLSYRDGVLIQLAYKIVDRTIDATLRPTGARTTAKKLGKLFAEKHIKGVNDAYENIGKNTKNLVRGTLAEWDALLPWMNQGTPKQLSACFAYCCCNVASTARPIQPMPELNISRLSFARVMSLYEGLLALPSGGVHEQMIVASLLDALVAAHAQGGFYVETKRVWASDKSSQAAGDIQIKTANRVLEAYEITAAGWEAKLHTIGKKLREHDLSRMHVVAPLAGDYEGVLSALLPLQDDVSVVDLRGFVSVSLSALTRQERAHALRRLYELLDRVQGDVPRVNAYVDALSRAELTVPTE